MLQNANYNVVVDFTLYHKCLKERLRNKVEKIHLSIWILWFRFINAHVSSRVDKRVIYQCRFINARLSSRVNEKFARGFIWVTFVYQVEKNVALRFYLISVRVLRQVNKNFSPWFQQKYLYSFFRGTIYTRCLSPSF